MAPLALLENPILKLFVNINLCRSFAPQHNIHQRQKFKTKLEIIERAAIQNTIVLGDFNLGRNDDNLEN